MKKVTFLLAALLIGGMMFTGCKKDNPSDTPETEKVYTVKYELLETAEVENSMVTVLPGCKFNVSYVGADGQLVELQDVTAPWSVTIDNFKATLTAKMEGTVSYDESQIPETDITFVKLPKITVVVGSENHLQDNFKVYKFNTKEKFLSAVQEHPNLLQFSVTNEL
jgi:hypothetical protein